MLKTSIYNSNKYEMHVMWLSSLYLPISGEANRSFPVSNREIEHFCFSSFRSKSVLVRIVDYKSFLMNDDDNILIRTIQFPYEDDEDV